MRREFATGWDGWLDDRYRGFPSGHDPMPANAIGGRGWYPADGAMALPLLSMSLPDFDANAAAMMDLLAAEGGLIAPHAKTPMSVDLARRLEEAGAWGATVADARQASVMLEGGLQRILLANGVGGRGGARRLARLMRHHRRAELHVFVDSAVAVRELAAAWAAEAAIAGTMPPLGLLAELGTGRGGLRTDGAAAELVGEVLALDPQGGLFLSGVAAYEGAATVADGAQSLMRVDALMQRMAALHAAIRSRTGPAQPLILTAGGSLWFDRVLEILAPVAAADGRTRLILRSGAVFFHDHGVYERGLAAMAARGALSAGSFSPALRLWAEVLSCPEPGLAVCGLGMRDAASDQGLPVPLHVWRGGERLARAGGIALEKFNDQHGFLSVAPGSPLRVGDVLEFGLSHPCTNLDRHALVWCLDGDGRVAAALPTSFG
ncbi:amino acid deaminase [Mangrovicoccus sp. HB161399]|uniref:amino acid deaminase n=1 Tax=Mangrovicoccus sp. HB161399 TaxID=2720392 RepID=UPI001557DD06|nr:amino acid deaminase [Mangrovicoccus sp. HB161399]